MIYRALKITISASLFVLFVSCSKSVPNFFILSDTQQIQILEEEDHGFCYSLNFGRNDEETEQNPLYWRCRISVAKGKKREEISREDVEYNLEITDLISKISIKLFQNPGTELEFENKKVDDHHHRQCLIMGFEIETNNQEKADEYFACRKILLENQRSAPAFYNPQYEGYKNDLYNLSFIVDQRVMRTMKLNESAREKYPTCVQFGVYSKNFKKCKAAQDKAQTCRDKLEKQKFDQTLLEKQKCQKMAYTEFPDDFLREEDRTNWEIENTKKRGDYANGLSLASLGIIDIEKFRSPSKESAENDAIREKNVRAINSKEGLYSKLELTKLRQKYAISCQRDSGTLIWKAVTNMSSKCDEMTKFDLEDEDVLGKLREL